MECAASQAAALAVPLLGDRDVGGERADVDARALLQAHLEEAVLLRFLDDVQGESQQ